MPQKTFLMLSSFVTLAILSIGILPPATAHGNLKATQILAAKHAKSSKPVDKSSLHITSSAVSLTVDDVPASRKFLIDHFGFHETMGAPGFSSLVRSDAAMNVIFLKRGMEILPKGFRDQRAAGVIVAFVVTDLTRQEARLRREGVKITMSLREEPWGERLFQVTDPNGIIFELVEWVTPKGR